MTGPKVKETPCTPETYGYRPTQYADRTPPAPTLEQLDDDWTQVGRTLEVEE